MDKPSTSKDALDQIKDLLAQIQYGSLEIYVCEGQVTQITQRHIFKTTNGKEK